MATTNVIFRGSVENVKPVQDEAIAAAEITPGQLLFKSAGQFTQHATAGGGAEVSLYIADLNFLKQGGPSDTWPSGDSVVAYEPRPGERYNMVVAASQDITEPDTPLTSNGDGTLKIGVPATDDILCYADQIVNTGGAAALVAVKF